MAELAVEPEAGWFVRHKVLAMVLGSLLVLIFILGILFGGWYALWAKIVYTVGAENYQLIPTICETACNRQDVHEYCDVLRQIRYKEKVRATYLIDTAPQGQTTVFRYTKILNGTCENIAYGVVPSIDQNGEPKEFSVSYPHLNPKKCGDLCSLS